MAKTVHFFSFIIIIKFPGKSPEQHALVEIFRAVHASEQHLPGERSPSPVVNAPLIWRPEQVGFRDTVCFLQKDGGAIPYDVGIYYIGALITMLGPVKSVCGFGAPALYHEKQLLFDDANADNWTIPGYNLITAALEFESGTLVSVHFNGNAVGGERSRIELYGTEAAMEVGNPDTFGGKVTLIRPESEPVTMPFTHGYNGINMLPEKSPFDFYGNRGIGVAELAWSIRKGRKNRLSKEYGLHCQEILQGIDEAVQTGKRVDIVSRCEVKPLRSGFYSSMNGMRGDAERSLAE